MSVDIGLCFLKYLPETVHKSITFFWIKVRKANSFSNCQDTDPPDVC